MTQNQQSQDYDWDEHFRVFEQLRELDIYSLQLTGSRPMTRGVIQNHLTEEFTAAARARGGIDPAKFYDFITVALRRVVGHANAHAELSASRANTLVNYMTELSQLFPEEGWRGQAHREVEIRGEQLREIKNSLRAIAPIYGEPGVVYQDDGMLVAALDAVDISIMQHTDISNRPLAQYTDQFPRMRALTLAHHQECVAKVTFAHAAAQTNLIDECLRLSTTMGVLPPQYSGKLRARMNSLTKVAHDLIVNASYTLDEAADFRNSSQLSKDIQRPIFCSRAP